MSQKYCCVPGCKESGDSHPVLHLFPNPSKYPDRFRSWVMAVGGDIIGLNDQYIYANRRVCHRHFEDQHCCRFNKISQLAVPRKHLPGLHTIPRFSFGERSHLRSIQNIRDFYPSTSKGAYELFGPEFEPGHHLVQESSDVLTEKLEDKENIETVKHSDGNTQTSETHTSTQGHSIAVDCLVERMDIAGIAVPVSFAENILQKTIPDSICAQPSTSTTVRNKLTTMKVTKRTKRQARQPMTTDEQKLYKKLVQYKVKLSKCRNRIKKQAACIKAAKKLTSNPALIKTMENMPNPAKILTLLQFREIKKKDKGRRFTLEEKILALSIFKQSAKCYRFLRKIFILPAPQTLVKLLNEADIRPGINKKIFTQLKGVTEKMKTEDRICILLFDEMSLKANVSYNERMDKVIGFVTNGQDTKPDYADHAQVFMIRGLLKNYKQPISYTFSAAATKGQELSVQIKQVVTELQKAGFIVVATVCDQGSNNRQAIKLLVQETRGDFLRRNQEPLGNVFIINDQEIVPLYDPPHMLKCIRNNLLSKDLQYTKDDNVRTAKWQHLNLLHQENPGYKGLRLIPKLTDNHVVPNKIAKMKVKYATQVFSQTVASNMGYLAEKGILPEECKDTADLLLFFDALFDSLNGSFAKKGKHGKPLLGPARPHSIHHKVWNDARHQLKTMKFFNSITKKVEIVPTINNWIWTLDGIQHLLKKLEDNYNITSVWMRHLNQDPIENFFGAIRSHGCRDVNPTPEKFKSAFTTLLINNMSSVHAPGANCERDFCNVLHALIVNNEDCEATAAACNLDKIPEITVNDVKNKNDPRVIGALQYVSGYFVRSAKNKIYKNCSKCTENLQAAQQPEYIKYREYADKQWLYSPTEPVLSCISAVQDISYDVLKNSLQKDNIKEFIKTLVTMIVDLNFIECETHKEKLSSYIINMSCRFFIFIYCKNINKIMNGRRDSDDTDDMFQVKAKKYCNKCFKRKK